MIHELYAVTGFEKVTRFVLRVFFDDGSEQTIDFRPVLWGEIFEPLKDPEFFDQVGLDPEIGTLTWPNGADFDPRDPAQLAEVRGGPGPHGRPGCRERPLSCLQ